MFGRGQVRATKLTTPKDAPHYTPMSDDPSSEPNAAPSPEAVAALVANHREFLRFVLRRVGDRALAEEIVQDAFVRVLDQGDQIRDSFVGWFYRVIRNAVIDRQRRQVVANRRLDEFALELAPPRTAATSSPGSLALA